MLPIIFTGYLGSWLKTYNQALWNHHFHNDQSFAQFMIEILIADNRKFKDFDRKMGHLKKAHQDRKLQLSVIC
jgi:hypothetical protein